MPDPIHVLVVDDDPDVRELLNDYLSEHGYSVAQAVDGKTARQQLEKQVPNVVLLDIGLPGEDGLSIARYLREHYDIGIIIVSGAGETVDRIIGLEIGADDYVSKPFDPRELRARLKNVARRYQRPVATETTSPTVKQEQNSKVKFGPCTLNLLSYQLLDRDGAEIPITNMEFDLLKVLAERPNRPLTRDQLLNLTQNRDWDPYDRSIDIRITRLRKKIEPDPEKPQVIKTVRGIGYMFVNNAR
ncbi:MAG: chemotaxis protein CheY [Gammaproteobacteria bacterium SG8_15]|nr:MAG: chemotaxis protein CheY [Gammaproteobacteria bacterium SG8_15]